MERTRPLSPEVAVCGFLRARVCAQLPADYAWLYDIDYDKGQAGGAKRGADGIRTDTVKLVSAFDRYYFRRDSK